MKTKNLILTALAVLVITNVSNAQWQKTNFTDDGKVVCIVSNGENIFAVTEGDYAGVFKSSNLGNKWTKLNLVGLIGHSGSPIVLTLAVSGKNIFAGTYDDGVYLSTNNGKSWTALNNGLPDGINVNSIAISGTNICASTKNRGIFFSPNNGNSWTAVNKGFPNNIVVNSVTISGTNIFAATQKGIFLSTDYGNNWTAVNKGLPNQINGSETWVESITANGSNIFAATGEDGIFLSTNNGSSWSAVNTGLPSNSTPLSHKSSTATIPIIYLLANGSDIFGIAAYKSTYSYGGGILVSTNNGDKWTTFNNGLPDGISIRSLAIIGTNMFCGVNDKGVWMCPLSSLSK